MNPILIGIITSAVTSGGVALGVLLRGVLPRHHLGKPSRDSIRLSIGLIATMTALVLGLITNSAKNSFDGVNNAVRDTAAQVLALDRALARYGPEAAGIRDRLKQVVEERVNRTWPNDRPDPAADDVTSEGTGHRAEALSDSIRLLEPKDELQRALQGQGVELVESILQARWLVAAGSRATVPTAFLVVLLYWLTMTFTCYGVIAPRNGTVMAVQFVCALSVGCAMFVVIELDGPFDGVIRVSPEPLRVAHSQVNR